MICESCGYNSIEYDFNAREYICSNCGLVVGVDLDNTVENYDGKFTGDLINNSNTKLVSIHLCECKPLS